MTYYYLGGVLLIGLVAGVLSGLFGIGGGVIIVPALVMLFGLSQQTAQGTTLAMLSIPVSLVAALNYTKAGMVSWKFAIFLAIGFVIGGFFGSKFAVGIDGAVMKKMFAILMIILAVKMLLEKK
jgi:uncharacterized membrane protein YfcA